jgi:type II secretory pathway pseudopilin PulG
MVMRTRSRARAFALVDAIVAGVLLGIGLAIILGLASRAIASQRQGEELQRAAMLADELLNSVLAVGPEEFDSVFESRGRFDAPFDEYAYDVALTPGDESDPFLVEATIIWNTAGRDRTLTIETLVAPRRGEEPDPERQPEETVGRNE